MSCAPWLGFESVPALPAGPSVLSLPFVNATDNPAQDYFVDGITAEIITTLTRYRDL